MSLAFDVSEEERIAVQSVITEARRVWPGISLSSGAFFEYLQAKANGTSLKGLHVQDLYLCAACLASDRVALQHFSTLLHREAKLALLHMDQSGDLTSEVHQQLYGDLFVAQPPRAAKIESYRGTGPLGRWLHVVVTRQALMWLRKSRKELPTQDGGDLVGRDFELDYLKREYRGEFSLAFEEAMSKLSAKSRNLLYYHTVKGLSLEQMSAMYRVHRTTVFRWLRDARQEILAYTRENLATRLLLDEEQVDSILAMIRSRMDVSVERLLKEGDGKNGPGE